MRGASSIRCLCLWCCTTTTRSDGDTLAHDQHASRSGLAVGIIELTTDPSTHPPPPTNYLTYTPTPQPSLHGLVSNTPQVIPFPGAAHGQPLFVRPALPLLVRHTLSVPDNGNMRHIVIISPASERALEGREKFVYRRLHRNRPRSLGSCRMH